MLAAAPHLPAVIYNSPYYGFETRADLFFDLRREHTNLVGFKEFGGRESLSYAAEHITSADLTIIEAAGHMVMLERPVEVALSVSAFLKARIAAR